MITEYSEKELLEMEKQLLEKPINNPLKQILRAEKKRNWKNRLKNLQNS